MYGDYINALGFPAPREVDREIYLTVTESNATEEDVSAPSQGE